MKRATLGVFILLAIVLTAGWIHAGAPQPAPKGLPGELVYTQGSTTWRLQQGACEHEQLMESINDSDHIGNRAKAARVESGSRDWAACWINSYGAEYIIADHRGVAYLPQEWFSKR